MFLLVSADLS